MLHQAKLLMFSVVLPAVIFSLCNAQEMSRNMHHGDEKLGKVHFPISCSPAEQIEFDRAMALLHSFWYEKAGETFAEIARREPSCAIAYWGVAMTLYHPLWEKPNAESLRSGWEALEKAKTTNAGTNREKGYIAAAATFYEDYAKIDHLTRVLAYETTMEQLRGRYADDREAGVFYALALISSALSLPPDRTYKREKKAADILNKVLAAEPEHPGAIHYLIHAYDVPQLAPLALNAARSYARIAPSVPHTLHMPSHIFTRLGLWQESIQSNIASEAAAKKFATEMGMDGAWDEQLHAMDYLMYAYLQGAQDKQAKALLDELYQIHKTNTENFKVGYAFAAIPARYAIERRQWSEAASLKLYPSDFPWNRIPWAGAVIYFARAVGEARSGQPASARKDIDKLGALETMLSEPKERAQVEIQRLAASAWAAYAEGKREEALSLMRSAADLEDTTEKHPVTPGPIVPAREMLGDLLLELGEPEQALKEFETALVASPNRFGSLLGAARAAKRMKNAEKARSFYSKLTAICDHADSDRPGLKEARTFLRRK
jgi:tetratricopeptide (TPR) repeat protein